MGVSYPIKLVSDLGVIVRNKLKEKGYQGEFILTISDGKMVLTESKQKKKSTKGKSK